MLLIFVLALVVSLASAWKGPIYHEDVCEAIRVPLCQSNVTKYSITRLPNIMGYMNQDPIIRFTEQQDFLDLIATNCSEHLVFFLCASLVPICVNMTSLNGNTNFAC